MISRSKCFFCGKPATDRHHIFGGPNRNNSEKYGLVVHLCRECHDKIHFKHEGKEMMELLRDYGQRVFEEKHPDLDFMKIFHRNYKKED